MCLNHIRNNIRYYKDEILLSRLGGNEIYEWIMTYSRTGSIIYYKFDFDLNCSLLLWFGMKFHRRFSCLWTYKWLHFNTSSLLESLYIIYIYIFQVIIVIRISQLVPHSSSNTSWSTEYAKQFQYNITFRYYFFNCRLLRSFSK